VPRIRRTSGRFLLLLVGAVVAVTGLGWWFWNASAEYERIERFTPTGEATVVVAYTGGSCESRRSVSVDESDETVAITIRTWTFAWSCDDVGHAREVEVTLDRPLGDRELVDDADTGPG